MAGQIQKPQIPSRRDRLQVSPERRAEARAGMGGEQVNPTQPLPAPVVEALASPAAPAPVATVTPAELATPPAPAELVPAPTEAAPVAVAPAPTEAAASRRRGRKEAPAAQDLPMEPERSVKIPESMWEDIRVALVQFPKGEELPKNIKSYLVAAHLHYQAYLRKHNKLPPAK